MRTCWLADGGGDSHAVPSRATARSESPRGAETRSSSPPHGALAGGRAASRTSGSRRQHPAPGVGSATRLHLLLARIASEGRAHQLSAIAAEAAASPPPA